MGRYFPDHLESQRGRFFKASRSAKHEAMRPQIHRIPRLRPPSRPLTQLPRSRPQLPFLSQPRAQQQQHTRFLTTERARWLRREIWKAGRFTAVLWSSGALLFLVALGVQQEWLERRFPSPHEWSLVSRKDFRSAVWEEARADDDADAAVADWMHIALAYREVLRRLEDPKIDGAGLGEQEDGGMLVAGVGRTGFDVSGKPESWRRGYHKVLMGCGRAAEHLDGWVKDGRNNVVFPPAMVRGPSNPNPQPIPPGSPPAPREEDCELAFEAPETFYVRILTTRGFTDKQRLDAALAQATWLEFKGTPGAALEMYKWAVDIAAASSPRRESLFDAGGAISASAGPVSSNVLTATTALAVHHARNSSPSTALSIFLSILRARRALPAAAAAAAPPTHGTDDDDDDDSFGAARFVRSVLTPPKYPPPPSDGTAPPPRDAKAHCEEAAVMAYIGEILYALAPPGPGGRQQDGLAWTRDAVDVAEEELRRLVGPARSSPPANDPAVATCRQCLQTALDNWATMVDRLAREDRDARRRRDATAARAGISRWLRSPAAADDAGRWDAEAQVVRERAARAAALLLPRPAVDEPGALFA